MNSLCYESEKSRSYLISSLGKQGSYLVSTLISVTLFLISSLSLSLSHPHTHRARPPSTVWELENLTSIFADNVLETLTEPLRDISESANENNPPPLQPVSLILYTPQINCTYVK